MYKNVLEVKNNIDSLKWGREEKVTNTISRRRLINDGASGYSYKYYMPTSPNKYVVMSAGKRQYVGNDITADAVAFGVDNGTATKTVDYLNDDYRHNDKYFRDTFFDKLGNTAIKDFKLNYQRKQEKSKNESADKYAKTVKKEFIENLKPKLITTAEREGLKLSDFNVFNTAAGGIFPRMRFYLGKLPVVVDHSISKGEKYYGYIPTEPRNNKQIPYFNRVDKVLQILVNFINNTLSERTKRLIKDSGGRNLRVQAKLDKDKKGTREDPGTSLRLQYEENIGDNNMISIGENNMISIGENNMIITEEMGFGKAISKFEKAIDKLETKNNKAEPKNEKDKNNKLAIKGLIKLLRHNLKVIKILNNYSKEDFADEESAKKVKTMLKKMLDDQKKTMSTLKDSKIVKYIKEIGGGLIVGSIIGGLSYFFNKLALDHPVEINHGFGRTSAETKLLPGGLVTGLMGLNKETFNKYTPEEFMKFSAAEAGAWTGLLAAKMGADYYKDGYNVHIYNAKKEDKKTIKEDYFPY